jgi:hypothetical protein
MPKLSLALSVPTLLPAHSRSPSFPARVTSVDKLRQRDRGTGGMRLLSGPITRPYSLALFRLLARNLNPR